MSHDPLACPDPLAARRFAYGQAAVKDGDSNAAADLFSQTLEIVPDWAPAHFALAEAREKLGDVRGAGAAYRAALAADSSDTLGAGARLALIEGRSPKTLSQSYVAKLFDDYAHRFEAHLTGDLKYRGPELLVAALDEAAPGRSFAHALDLGCGTGLMGHAIRSRVEKLMGVDVAPAMVAKARGREIYDALALDDARAFVERAAPQAFDLILAADALCYFGDLAPLLGGCAGALAPGGLLAVTAETFAGDGFRLQPTMRFAHAPAYICAVAAAAGLRPCLVRSAWARREAGAETPGLVAVFERT